MAFAALEDLSGKIEIIVFPKVYEEFAEILNTEDPVVMSGFVNLAEEPRKFFPSKITYLKEQAESRVSGVRINVDTEKLTDYSLEKLKRVLLSFRGPVKTHMIFEHPEGRAKIDLGEDYLVNPTPQMAAKINEVLNSNAVSFIIDGKLEQIN